MSKVPAPRFQFPPSTQASPVTARFPVNPTSPPSEFCRVKVPFAVREVPMVNEVGEAEFGSIMTFDRGKAPVIVWPLGTISKVPAAAKTVPAVQVMLETERIVPARVSTPVVLLNCKIGIFPVVRVSLPENV